MPMSEQKVYFKIKKIRNYIGGINLQMNNKEVADFPHKSKKKIQF